MYLKAEKHTGIFSMFPFQILFRQRKLNHGRLHDHLRSALAKRQMDVTNVCVEILGQLSIVQGWLVYDKSLKPRIRLAKTS